jgi:hypothetical protein
LLPRSTVEVHRQDPQGHHRNHGNEVS